MTVYHLFEYLFVCAFHPSELKWDSFLLNQSKEYVLAAVVSWVEYAAEFHYKPSSMQGPCLLLGVPMILVGHYCRIGAMFTAARSFHHVVQTKKASTHTLVTSGIYSWLRHPSYFGWSLWAIGTQVLLGNPICVGLYCYAAWLFFKDRIPFEEHQLVKFFGPDYIAYAKRVPHRMPFIRSYFDNDSDEDDSHT